MNNNELGIVPQVSPLRNLISFAVILVLGCFVDAAAQWTPTGNDIYNSNSGNVGIGTNGAPSSLLEVKKSQSAGTAITVDNPFTTSGNSALSGLFFKQAGVNRFFVGSINDNNITHFGGGGAAQLWNFANAPTLFATNNAERMRLTSGGNLGIGTTSPNERLVTLGNMLVGNITSHTQLYSTYDSQSNMIFELGYGTATSDITPLPSLVLSKNLTGTNTGAGVISFANSNIANGNDKRLATISVFTDGALNSGAFVFGTTASGTLNERLRITSGGNIGIGTSTPGYRLEVVGASTWLARFKKTDNSNGGIIIDTNPGYNPNVALAVNGTNKWHLLSNSSSSDSLQFWDSPGTSPRFTLTQAGTVGIGNPTPNSSYKLDVTGKINTTDALCIVNDCKTAWSQIASQWNTSGSTINYASGNVGIATPSPTEKLHVTGNVKIVGDIDVSGNIKAKYQDVAEWVESSQELAPGTVVVVDSTRANQVIASTEGYDSRVAGVISLKPGLQLGEHGEGRVLVATTGRVKVKVDASSGPIKIGDLLVTSDKEGFAMKSVPVEFGRVRMHRPGTLIGKALEPLAQGTGEILVLLSLQ